MHIPLLQDIVLLFVVSIAVLFVCHRIHLPSVVGYLLTGILIGPHGLGLVRSVHEVEVLAEIGIVLLLFTIGIEFSIQKLLQIRRSVLLGGGLQVGLTLAVVAAMAALAGTGAGEAIFIGCLLALSSTAIVLRLLQERAEIDSPHGRTVLAMLIFQDLVIVPMMLATPILAGQSESPLASLLLLLKAAAVVVLLFVTAKWAVPRLLLQTLRTRDKELFLLTVVAICLTVAWLTGLAGLSLGLGAFLAGLVISESEYSHQALDGILPFRDVFTSFFFLSVGMLLDTRILIGEPVLILGAVVGILALKSLLAGGVAMALGGTWRSAVLTGLALGQVGEFSFILARHGLQFDMLAPGLYQRFIAVSVITMAVTPFIVMGAPWLADRLLRAPWLARRGGKVDTDFGGEHPEWHDHLVVVGYGLNGRNLVRAARSADIPYVVIEMNADTVRAEQRRGEPVFFGDAVHPAVLEHAAIQRARVLVIAISDPSASARITSLAREANPGLHIIVRTRFAAEIERLRGLGANDVIPEEFETAVEIFTRVLNHYLVPRDEIDDFTSRIRAEHYDMFRLRNLPSTLDQLNLHLADTEIRPVHVTAACGWAERSLADLDLRSVCGVTVLAVNRDGTVHPNPGGSFVLAIDDVLIAMGTTEQIAALERRMTAADGT